MRLSEILLQTKFLCIIIAHFGYHLRTTDHTRFANLHIYMLSLSFYSTRIRSSSIQELQFTCLRLCDV